MTLWLIRSGKYGERENLALDKGVATIGWPEVPDLSPFAGRDALLNTLGSIYPDAKQNTLRNWASQLWTFRNAIEPGDLIILPLKGRPMIAIGEVTGDYKYRSGLTDAPLHTRPVKWLSEFPRGAFDEDILFSLGAMMTVCRIQRHEAEERIRAMLGKGAGPKRTVAATVDAGADTAADAETELDLQQSARDQIAKHIARKFAGHGLTRLVDALLQAQGFTTRVSPPGRDGGVDIVAGKGPFGFDAPRVVVQVKSGDTSMDVKPVRELQGILQNFNADHGLFVSWAGYLSGVESELSRRFFQIRLWDSSDLIDLIQRHYDDLPEEIRAELPLTRIWTLVPEDVQSTA